MIVHYLPFLIEFLRVILTETTIKQGISLVIDGSQMGSKHVALVVSLVWKNRSIPICWLIRKGKKGHKKAPKQNASGLSIQLSEFY